MLESAWESEWRIVDCRSSFIHEIQDSEGEFESRAQTAYQNDAGRCQWPVGSTRASAGLYRSLTARSLGSRSPHKKVMTELIGSKYP